MIKTIVTLSLAMLIFTISSDLFACASCVGGNSQSKMDAYSFSTLMLTFIPFIIGGTFYFVYRYFNSKTI